MELVSVSIGFMFDEGVSVALQFWILQPYYEFLGVSFESGGLRVCTFLTVVVL